MRDYGENRIWRFNFLVSDKEREALERLATSYGMSMSATIRLLIREAAARAGIFIAPEDPIEIMDIEEWELYEDPEVIKYAPELLTHT